MAIKGTAQEGLDAIVAARVYISGTDLQLVAYTNTADSLSPASVLGDLTQPTVANGYAPITLDGTWASSGGVVTYTHSTPVRPAWVATGAWSGVVTGAAVTDGTYLLHWQDLDTSFTAAADRKLAIDLDTIVA